MSTALPRIPPTLRCPHDGTDLRVEDRDGLLVEVCGGCGGWWFDRDELATATHDPALAAWAAAAALAAPASAVACPRCGAACFHSEVASLAVDTCGRCHGVWVDGAPAPAAAGQDRSAPLGR